MLATTLQGAFLSALSNILAQVISAYKGNDPISIAWRPVFNFALFALLSTPPNILWQEFLENTFPGITVEVPNPKGKEKEGTNSGKPSTRLNKRNTATKILLDQTIAGTINAAAFLAFFAYLRKPTFDNVLQTVQNDLPSVYFAGLKLWPAVSIICFSAIPVQQRVLVGSLAGMGWNIYLSLLAAS